GLAPPTHLRRRTRRPPHRLGHPRRQSHDHDPATPHHHHPRPPRIPCRTTNPAATTRRQPARGNPRPPPNAPSTSLTIRPTKPQPGPHTANPARHPGRPHALTPTHILRRSTNSLKINTAHYPRNRVRRGGPRGVRWCSGASHRPTKQTTEQLD